MFSHNYIIATVLRWLTDVDKELVLGIHAGPEQVEADDATYDDHDGVARGTDEPHHLVEAALKAGLQLSSRLLWSNLNISQFL